MPYSTDYRYQPPCRAQDGFGLARSTPDEATGRRDSITSARLKLKDDARQYCGHSYATRGRPYRASIIIIIGLD